MNPKFFFGTRDEMDNLVNVMGKLGYPLSVRQAVSKTGETCWAVGLPDGFEAALPGKAGDVLPDEFMLADTAVRELPNRKTVRMTLGLDPKPAVAKVAFERKAFMAQPAPAKTGLPLGTKIAIGATAAVPVGYALWELARAAGVIP